MPTFCATFNRGAVTANTATNGDAFAAARIFAGFHDDGVVTGVDSAIANHNITATINIKAVVIWAKAMVINGDMMQANIVATAQVQCPTGAFLDTNIANGDIATSNYFYAGADAWASVSYPGSWSGCGCQNAGPWPSIRTAATDSNVMTVLGYNEMSTFIVIDIDIFLLFRKVVNVM